MVSGVTRDLMRPAALAVTAGLLLVTTADVAFGLRNLRGAWAVLTPWDGLWDVGYLLVGAGVGALRSSPPAAGEEDGCCDGQIRDARRMATWRPLLPYGLIPAVGVLVVYTTLHAGDELLGRGVYAGSAVLFVLVLLRQVLSIRENARLNALLWESQERYRLVLRATNDVLWDWDPVTDALYCSDALATDYGYPRREIGGGFGFFRDAIHPDDRERVLDGFRAALDGAGESWADEYRFRCADGAYAAVLDRGFIVRDAEGRAVRMIGSMLDLTRRERAAALERERTSLTAAVTAMDQVLGVVGHELRTPLAGARAISELLLSSEVRAGDQAQGMLTGLHDEVVRMSDTIDALLEAARLNSGRATWNWSRFPVGQVCLEAADSLRALVDPRRVALQVDVAPLGAEMLGDAEAARRLILNLLSNARKHTERGFIRVEVRAETDGGGCSWIRIMVSDSGSGIEPDVLARLGQAFALNSGVVGPRYVGGTGLGLAICKGIVQVHGGCLTVRSEAGRGTTVTVRLRSDLDGPEPLTGKIGFTGEQQACDAMEAL
jgi:PAS domain S-box-containing protein